MKKIFSLLLLLSLMSLSVISINVFADSENVFTSGAEVLDKKWDLYKEFSAQIMAEKTCIKNFSYIEEAVGKEKMIDVIAEYNKVYSDSKAYLMLKNSINSIYEEAAANNFSKQQVKDLFIATSRLETQSCTENEMSFSREIPDFAPSHIEISDFENMDEFQSNCECVNLQSSDDRSARTNYETTGVGYEVKSKLNYNRTTTFLKAGDCNVTTPEGKAGYMFYTLYYNGNYQDMGIGYFDGKWKAVVSGYWTGWQDDVIPISSGDKLYFRIWIDDGKIYFQILDGNNFGRVVFEKNYSTNGQIPSSGIGVGFNRQITLVDTSHDSNSNLYLTNAIFNQSYLYNGNGYYKFNNNNTDVRRRGKFGCTWASDNVVYILNNSHWDSEKISIYMNER